MSRHTKAVASAVVFAYHDIGVRCLEALLELGVEIKLVVTHQDSESEHIWFDSVKEVAERNKIVVITPQDANSAAVIEHVSQCEPDYIFPFITVKCWGRSCSIYRPGVHSISTAPYCQNTAVVYLLTGPSFMVRKNLA